MKATALLACLVLLFGLATRAFGLAGELKEPGLAFPERFPEATRTNIMAALRQPDGSFLGGRFVNGLTTLQYGGETPALNRFLEGLATCPGVVLSIRFEKDHLPGGCDWLVSHDAGDPGRVAVRVNMNSPRIHLEDLVIPDL